MPGEMPHDDAEKSPVARTAAQRAVDAIGHVARSSDAGIDGTRVVVAPRVRLATAEDPLRSARETIEIGVTDDGFHRTDPLDDFRSDHFRTGAVLRLRRENESRIVHETAVFVVVVMIDPTDETSAEAVDERQCD